MSQPSLEIVKPGLFTTVQDLGRPGYQRFGVPVSGAMDRFALRAANALAGNDVGAAALEMTVIGPSITFLVDTWAALAGGDLAPRLNDVPLKTWRAFKVSAGSQLTFHGMQDGMRAYLAIAGGIDVPKVMGSRSTYAPSGFGGFEGRALAEGDVLAAFAPDGEYRARFMPADHTLPPYGDTHALRVILGPQHESFTPKSTEALLSSTFEISLDSDRMGYVLDGPALQHVAGAGIVSDGNPLGAIQVPGDGSPTILLADRGTTGGYARIATVIGVDVDRMAQAVPGNTVTFSTIDIEEAQGLLREQVRILEEISAGPPEVDQRVAIAVDGVSFEVTDVNGKSLTRAPSAGTATGESPQHVTATVGGGTYEFEVTIEPGGDQQQ
jgi:antagonist of KipI